MRVRSLAGRCRWYLRALGGNPLIRASDRLETLTVLAVLALALFAIPFASHTGRQTYDARMHIAAEQASTRHSVQAEAVEASTNMSADLMSSSYVRVQWPEGPNMRTERVFTHATVKPGDPFTVWLDQTGKVVEPPLLPTDAQASAVAAAATTWGGVVAASVLAAFLIRMTLDRSRARAWERELRLLSHNDDGWANKHI